VHLDSVRDDSGVIAILVAAMAVFLFALGAIVVDLGYARNLRAEAQDAADAAALAGIGELYADGGDSPNFRDAIDAVKRSVFDNYFNEFFDNVSDAEDGWKNDPAGSLPDAACQASLSGGWQRWPGEATGTNCIQFDGLAHPDRVRIVMPVATSPILLGGIVGYGGATISTVAAAGREPTIVPECSLCVFGELSVASGGHVGVHAGASGSVPSGGSLSVGTLTITDTPDTLAVDPPGRVTVFNPLVAPTPANGNAYTPAQAPLQPWPLTDPLSTKPPPIPSSTLRGDAVCGDGDRLSGKYANVTITGNCRFRRDRVITVTGVLTVQPGAQLDARGSTLMVTGTGSADVQGSITDLGSRREWGIYWASSGTLSLTDGDIAVEQDSHLGTVVLSDNSNLRCDSTTTATALSLDATSVVEIRQTITNEVRRHSDPGLVE
jgi:hypothetical protein